MQPEVIIHHLDQAKAALRAAADLGLDIQLRSTPDSAASAGVSYLHALGMAVGHELLIDCNDDAGLIMAALRTGCRKLTFSGPTDLKCRLDQMAGRYGAKIRGPTDRSPPCLALSPDDDDAPVRSWLSAIPTTQNG